MIELFGEVVALMGKSDIHKKWSVSDVGRLIIPPLLKRQYVELRDGKNLVGFGTYAFLTDEAAQGFVKQTRKLQKADWQAGENIWVIDAVAPFGHGSEFGRKLQNTLIERLSKGREVHFIRTKGDKRDVHKVVL